MNSFVPQAVAVAKASKPKVVAKAVAPKFVKKSTPKGPFIILFLDLNLATQFKTTKYIKHWLIETIDLYRILLKQQLKDLSS